MLKSASNLFDLTDKVVIITGGAGLIGRKHAEAVVEYGGTAILLDINDDEGYKAAEEISDEYGRRCAYFHCNITDIAEVKKINAELVKEYKRIDVLINNAAVDHKVGKKEKEKSFSRFENFSLEAWNKEINVGLTGAFLCSQVFGSQMAVKKSGNIINISSDLGIISPNQKLYRRRDLPEDLQPVKPVTYSVIKHGIIGLTKYIATYWAEKGIRANSLCPGGVYTDQPEDFVVKISELIPMSRMANISEYKGAIIFLASDASSYMNGASLVIDGGRTIL